MKRRGLMKKRKVMKEIKKQIKNSEKYYNLILCCDVLFL
jgi:predicted RNase H-related nuclease YkuK (DUF458 family)